MRVTKDGISVRAIPGPHNRTLWFQRNSGGTERLVQLSWPVAETLSINL